MLPTTTVPLTIRVENDYATATSFTHVLYVDVPAPDDADLTEWMMDELFPYTGEGPEYSHMDAIYSVQIIKAPVEHDRLLGLAVSAMG